MRLPRKPDEIMGCLLVFMGGPMLLAQWVHGKYGVPRDLTYLVLGIVACAAILWRWIGRTARAHSVEEIDAMSGAEFEDFLSHLLSVQGYTVTPTGGAGDLGVDLVAEHGEERIAIQAKRYSGKISRRAISDAVAGMNYYECNAAMVITNSYFTEGAEALAESNGCVLVDRDTLAEWVAEFSD